MSRYLIFAVAGLVLLLYSIGTTAVAVAFPVLTASFDTSLILAAWVINAYQLTATITMPLAGKVADVIGQKSTFLLCLALWTTGALLSAIAPNIELLILFRLMQGLGGGGFLPSAAGIVADKFPNSRQQALGLFTSIFPIGQIIGPNLGGWMTTAFGWRSIFWFNVPLGIIAMVAAAILLRQGKRGHSQIDIKGAGLFTGSLFAFMTGLSEIGNARSPGSWAIVAILLAASVVFMVAFVRHERRVKEPVIDLAVLRERPFIAANVFNFVFGACGVGILSFIPLYAVSVYNMSILESGLVLTPMSVAKIVAAAITSMSLVRWGYRKPMLIGSSAMIVGLALLAIEPGGSSIAGLQLSSTVLLLAIMLLIGAGIGLAAPAANNACIELMPHRVATITGIRGMFRQGGGTVGVAVVSLVLHAGKDMGRGFTIVFLSLAVVLLIAIPTIFAMPASTEAKTSAVKEPDRQVSPGA